MNDGNQLQWEKVHLWRLQQKIQCELSVLYQHQIHFHPSTQCLDFSMIFFEVLTCNEKSKNKLITIEIQNDMCNGLQHVINFFHRQHTWRINYLYLSEVVWISKDFFSSVRISFFISCTFKPSETTDSNRNLQC